MRALVWLFVWLTGCASALDARFVPPETPSPTVVAERLAHAPARKERAVVVAVTQKPARLVAYDLEKKALLWQKDVSPVSAPLLAGDAVVTEEKGAVVVRALATGEALAMLDGKLIAADGEGARVVLSLQHEGAPRGTVALVEGSSVKFKRTLGQPVGSVALSGDYVLVPWASQKLTVLSARDGSELARWNFPGFNVGRVEVSGDGVFFGQHTLLRMAADTPEKRDLRPAGYAPLKRVLPGQPAVLRDGYAPAVRIDSAEQRVATSFAMSAAEGALHAELDLLALRFYRLVFGLSAERDEVRWVKIMDHDQVGAQVTPAGLWLVDDAGSVRLLDEHGRELTRLELGLPLVAASVRASGHASAPEGGATVSVHDQLMAAIQLGDERLAQARAYAVELLSRDPDAKVTGELIALCTAPEGPEIVRLSACQRLAAREQGKAEVLAALRTRGSFLEGTPAPPVGALAQAAARMGLAEAASLLVTHAENPGTRAQDLPAVFDALRSLSHRPAVPTLERFVRLHHDEPQGSELSPALRAAIVALGGLGAGVASTRTTLRDVADDELGTKPVREEAKKALAALDTPAKPSAAQAAKEAPAEPAVQVDPRPYALDAESVARTLAPADAALARCVREDPAAPPSARVAMIVAGSGVIEGLLVSPTTLQPCMEGVLRKLRFPETRLGRQHVSRTVLGGP